MGECSALTPLGSIHETVTGARLRVNLNGAKLALTSGVSIFTQAVLLLRGNMLLCGDDTAVLVKNQLSAGETTGGLVGSSVPNLGARPLQHFVFLAVHVVITIITAVATFHHFAKSLVINYH